MDVFDRLITKVADMIMSCGICALRAVVTIVDNVVNLIFQIRNSD